MPIVSSLVKLLTNSKSSHMTKRYISCLTFLFILCLVLLSTSHVIAKKLVIGIELFIAEPTQNDQMELFFETGSEIDTVDLFFIRGLSENAPVFTSPSPSLAITVTYNGAPTRFIPAQGSVL